MVVKRSAAAAASTHGGRKAIKGGIMVLIVVTLIGYLFMWIIIPTATYFESWLPKIRAHTNSTFLGDKGERILTYTFPLLFIAVLASIYLHLEIKLNESNSKRRKNWLGRWRKPLVIKWLGIVSWIELGFLIMFIALLIWTFSGLLHYFFARIGEFSMSGEKIWETKLGLVALVLGLVGNLTLTLLFFPVTRGSSVLLIFGLTSEASIKYHIWLGHTAMAIFTAHGVFYIMYWISTNQLSEMINWNKTRVSNVAGELSLLFGLILWVTTYPRIRRKMFELFFYTHYLYILFIIFFVLHLGISYSCIMLPGFYLFMIDRYLRFLQSRQRVRLVSARVLPCETSVELNFSKSQALSYTPTSIIYINVPSISKLQWHPFTISSSSNLDPELLSVIIKPEGNWTKKLSQMLGPSFTIDQLQVSVEGPYGPVSTSFLRHDVLVMVSGGSGISPFISIIREFIFVHTTLKQNTPKLLLISAFKNSTDLTMLDLLLPISNTTSPSFALELQIEAYVTREKEPPIETPVPPRTIWFKPSTSDAPISPTLGRNGWLWLGAIVAFSFIIFLVFIGILTRYYIYPIDHNMYRFYPTSSRALLNMLFICMSIVMTASAAFLWNKKQNTMETKHIQDSELNYAEKELESLPYHSLLQSTKTHYGQRPDLKKMLLECKDTSVGVLVCGPKQMRHDVAKICSSGSATNLHFESTSFTW